MRASIVLLAGVLLIACGGGAAEPVTPAGVPTTGATLEKSPDSGQVDRVGAADGALKPDGVFA